MAEQERLNHGPENTRENLVNSTNRVLALYAERAMPTLREMVRSGQGKQVLGSVPNRPTDEQLGVDAIGENVLVNIVREQGLSAQILGEHVPYDYKRDNNYVTFAIDPFDNTSQYKLGLDTPPYTVTGAYYSNGEPIGAIVGDIKDSKVYLAINGETYIRDLETGRTEPIRKSERKSLKEDGAVLATYLGEKEYSLPFFENFKSLIENMSDRGRLYAGGGAYIYALLASGAVDAYVMVDEPRTEIDPGAPIALAAGCGLWSVNEDGTFEEYKFEPEKYGENVPLFIAAATSEVRDEIISNYLSSKK